MPVIACRTPLSRVAGIVAGCLLLIARGASAQYNVDVLLPPADMPTTATTRALAINGSEQVFGYVFSTPSNPRLVLWTNGLPEYLSLPAGYDWGGDPGHNFLNDSGRIVSQVVPQGGPGYSRRIVYWDALTSPQVVSLAPNTCGSTSEIALGSSLGPE
jgi:hypothetical protein